MAIEAVPHGTERTISMDPYLLSFNWIGSHNLSAMACLQQAYLMTADMARSRRFYEDLLGLKPARVGDMTTSYDTGECELKIQSDFSSEVLATFNMDPPPETGRGAGAVHVLELDNDLDNVFEDVVERIDDVSGEILMPPREVSWGGHMFLVESPEGYTFEVRGSDGM